MWKRLQDTQYYILFTKDFVHEICITDYVNIWTTIFSEKTFLAQLKENNVGLELDNDGVDQENKKFIQKGLQLLSNPEKLKKISVVLEENNKTLKLKMIMWYGYNFCFECKLSKGSEELFFHKVTHMLLKTISDLRSSENELRSLLISKDKEIEEYKCEGGKIAHCHKTLPFNNREHLKKYKLYEENFGLSNVPTDLIKKGDDILRNNDIKQEHVADLNMKPVPVVKTEPSSQPGLESACPIPLIQSFVKREPEVKRETVNGCNKKKRKKFNL
ncbi:uncharacterized protein LOC113500908 [Trichoplusia ni]|uniref:Uncharacterized protein LOC113500908 n=1 Tax=Trichoplusia ni TaxID=7111 RepID=A0A7E5WBV6_TRINI|nr:uncharacterized protein LOC113500908 [Trichoplusia ni]